MAPKARKYVPGPGEYHEGQSSVLQQNLTSNKPPSWKLGKAERDVFSVEIKRSYAPGPGAYDANLKSKRTDHTQGGSASF